MSRSDGLTARFLRVLRLLGGGSRKGDSPSFVRRNSGQSPTVNEAAILDWLEDGEEIDDEEKYWHKTDHHEKPALEAKTDKTAAVGQESREGASSDETGMAAAVPGGKPTLLEDHPSAKTKTRLRNGLSILPDLADVVRGFFKSLRATDWLLLGAVVVLLVVVVMMLFPVTLTWAKAIVNVRKWPWWIWTCISLAVLGYLVWLRSRYE